MEMNKPTYHYMTTEEGATVHFPEGRWAKPIVVLDPADIRKGVQLDVTSLSYNYIKDEDGYDTSILTVKGYLPGEKKERVFVMNYNEMTSKGDKVL